MQYNDCMWKYNTCTVPSYFREGTVHVHVLIIIAFMNLITMFCASLNILVSHAINLIWGPDLFSEGGRGKKIKGLETLAALPCALGMSIRLVILEV